ncbi:MAG: ATPase, partial [Gammaproteobacteria bacterium]
MRMTREEFFAWPTRRLTFYGMSGVGKTRLANMLRGDDWFHYSVDYRIGTRYLGEAILDNIKRKAMQVDFLRELLLSDSIYISNNLSVDNLTPLSTFLGMVGNPEKGGLTLAEFKHRQALHYDAEVQAMRDVPAFIDKAADIYGYEHFLNDASGSLCEIDDEAVFEAIARDTLMIYIEASDEDEQFLIERAAANPKPLYYREPFLDEHLARYMHEQGHEYVVEVDPEEYVRWVFPHLFRSRVPRFQAITEKYGYA